MRRRYEEYDRCAVVHNLPERFSSIRIVTAALGEYCRTKAVSVAMPVQEQHSHWDETYGGQMKYG